MVWICPWALEWWPWALAPQATTAASANAAPVAPFFSLMSTRAHAIAHPIPFRTHTIARLGPPPDAPGSVNQWGSLHLLLSTSPYRALAAAPGIVRLQALARARPLRTWYLCVRLATVAVQRWWRTMVDRRPRRWSEEGRQCCVGLSVCLRPPLRPALAPLSCCCPGALAYETHTRTPLPFAVSPPAIVAALSIQTWYRRVSQPGTVPSPSSSRTPPRAMPAVLAEQSPDSGIGATHPPTSPSIMDFYVLQLQGTEGVGMSIAGEICDEHSLSGYVCSLRHSTMVLSMLPERHLTHTLPPPPCTSCSQTPHAACWPTAVRGLPSSCCRLTAGACGAKCGTVPPAAQV